MTMYMISGKVVNVYKQPLGKTKDGREFGGEQRVQIQGDVILKNGEKKVDLVNLKAVKGQDMSPLIGTDVVLDAGYFISNGQAMWFLADNKNLKPKT